MARPGTLTLTQQRYVETVFALERDARRVRTTDLAARLGVRPPSASETVKRLVGLGVALRPSRHRIALSRRGRTIARRLDRRHGALRTFMVDVLGMDNQAADTNACRMEHWASADLIDRCVAFAAHARARRGGGRDWLESPKNPCRRTRGN